MSVIVRWPRNSPHFTSREMAEGARFENPEASETIVPDLVSSSQSQSLAEGSEANETAIKTDGTQ